MLDWNTPAIGFYERLGATVMPDWRIVRVTGDALDPDGQRTLIGARRLGDNRGLPRFTCGAAITRVPTPDPSS